MDEHESLIDEEYADSLRSTQSKWLPRLYWTDKPRRDPKTGEEYIPKPEQVVSTILSDLDTTKEHYVKIPENHIVIDFDLTDNEGKKSAERNLEAASTWPSTYAEYSKSGSGVHLHYETRVTHHSLVGFTTRALRLRCLPGIAPCEGACLSATTCRSRK
jgi:hypothetical protein